MDDMKVIEINEAFSTVVQASCYELGIPMDDERLNPWGGAMALGHPTGMTGCRLVGTILHQLEKKQEDVGLATLCVGLGMGIGVVVRREGS
jgi:3-oxoadipyl-CoA thiolase